MEHLHGWFVAAAYAIGLGILVADAAADLGVSERALREDLELLWVCGLPGYGPGDLIDMAFDGDRVTVTYDAGIDRPLRLTHDEALALIVALRMLAQVPGGHSREAVERALAKIESAADDAAAGLPIAVRLPGTAIEERVAQLQAAVQHRHALRMTYYTATRDELTERVVDPMRVLLVGGGGLVGIVVSWASASAWKVVFAGALPNYFVTGATVALGAAISVAIGLLGGAVPAWRLSRSRPVDVLREDA